MADITLEPGSPSARLAAHLKANPEAQFDRRSVAAFLVVAGAYVDTALQPAITAGLVTVGSTPDLGRVWRAGPRLAHWTLPNQPATKPAAAKPGKGRRRERLPLLDPASLKVGTGAPPPVAQSLKGATRHDATFDLLTADGMHVLGVPMAYRGSMSKAVQVYMEQRPALRATSAILVRTVDAKTIGLWRVSRAEFNLRSYAGDKPRSKIARAA